MKNLKLILIALITIAFISCNSQKKDEKQLVIVELISVVELQKIDRDVQLIDVRTPEEYAEGYIKNAVNINFYDDDFLEQMSALDKDKPVYVYCRLGGRSGKASAQLKEAGFTKVYDLEGGITKWLEDEKVITQDK